MRNVLTTIAEVAGAICVVVGVGFWSIPAALVSAGVLLIVGGVGAAS